MGLAHLVLQSRRGGLASELFLNERQEPVTLARAVLTHAIEELARPIDSVKHQAKTVTVGTSRNNAGLYDSPLIEAMEDAGADRHSVTLPALRVVRAHARLVKQVTGVTRYRLQNRDAGRTILVVGKTGIAAGMVSRAERESPLRGSKRRIAELRMPRLLRGHVDGRVVFVVPEQNAEQVNHLTLVHIILRDHCPADALTAAMDSVGDRMEEIIAAVTEISPSFAPEQLSTLLTEHVLLAPVEWLGEQLAMSRGPA